MCIWDECPYYFAAVQGIQGITGVEMGERMSELPEKREIEILRICEGGNQIMCGKNQSVVVEMVEYVHETSVRTVLLLLRAPRALKWASVFQNCLRNEK
jgi:hypothetical protein